MIRENREHLISPEQKIVTVEAIVHEKPEVAGLQVYEYLRPANAAAEKEAFIKGEKPYPNLTYPDLAPGKTDELANYSELALLSMLPGEKSPKVTALFDAIEYRQAELFMLQMASRMHNKQLSDDERQEAQEWFKMTVEAVYGVPDKEVFSALAERHLMPEVRKALPETQPNARKIQQELRELLGPIDHSDYEPFQPSPELVQRIGALTHERFDKHLDFIDPGRTYDVDEIVEVLKTYQRNNGHDKLGWRTEKIPDSASLATSAHQKLVEVGENRDPLLGKDLKELVLHEAEIHEGKSVEAEKAGWPSAAYGQDGYLDFEEALATVIQDAFRGEFVDHGVDYYLGAGLGYGLDNHDLRDLKGIHEILWRTSILRTLKEDVDVTEKRIQKAKSFAYTKTFRLIRSTSGDVPGLIFTKDLSYFRGQELAWSVLKDVHTQEDFDLLFAGKLDLTRADHRKIAEAILAENRKASQPSKNSYNKESNQA